MHMISRRSSCNKNVQSTPNSVQEYSALLTVLVSTKCWAFTTRRNDSTSASFTVECFTTDARIRQKRFDQAPCLLVDVTTSLESREKKPTKQTNKQKNNTQRLFTHLIQSNVAVEHYEENTSTAEPRPTSGTGKTGPFEGRAQASHLVLQLRAQRVHCRSHSEQQCTVQAWRVRFSPNDRRPSPRSAPHFQIFLSGTHHVLLKWGCRRLQWCAKRSASLARTTSIFAMTELTIERKSKDRGHESVRMKLSFPVGATSREISQSRGNHLQSKDSDVLWRRKYPKCLPNGVFLNLRETEWFATLLCKFGAWKHVCDELSFYSVRFAAKLRVLHLFKVWERKSWMHCNNIWTCSHYYYTIPLSSRDKCRIWRISTTRQEFRKSCKGTILRPDSSSKFSSGSQVGSSYPSHFTKNCGFPMKIPLTEPTRQHNARVHRHPQMALGDWPSVQNFCPLENAMLNTGWARQNDGSLTFTVAALTTSSISKRQPFRRQLCRMLASRCRSRQIIMVN